MPVPPEYSWLNYLHGLELTNYKSYVKGKKDEEAEVDYQTKAGVLCLGLTVACGVLFIYLRNYQLFVLGVILGVGAMIYFFYQASQDRKWAKQYESDMQALEQLGREREKQSIRDEENRQKRLEQAEIEQRLSGIRRKDALDDPLGIRDLL